MKSEDLMAYLDGELSREDQDRVERELEQHPDWGAVLLEYCRQRLLLAEICREKAKASHDLLQREMLLLNRLDAERFPTEQTALRPEAQNNHPRGFSLQTRTPPVKSFRAQVIWAVAACFAILVGIGFYFRPGQRQVLARIEAANPGTFIERGTLTVPALPGATVKLGDTIRSVFQNGGVKFRYVVQNTLVEVMGKAELKLDLKGPTKVLELRHGAVQAWVVAAQSGGHRVLFRTPHAEAEVLGTTLTLVSTTDHTWLQVDEGQVLLTRRADGASVNVNAGFFAVATPGASLKSQPVGLCDLIVTDIAWSPPNPMVGDAVFFRATIKNQGKGPTPSGVIQGVGFNVADKGTATWSASYISPLAPGESVTLVADGGPKGTNAWFATVGTHNVTATVDDIRRIPESSDANNASWTRLRVQPREPEK